MQLGKLFSLFLFLLAVSFAACKKQEVIEEKNIETAGVKEVSEPPLFTLLSPAQTNINFSNVLTEGMNTNILMYEYFYNGGGVAIGDLNGDGLEDIYFTANMSDNKLYLNKGKMKFEDVTMKSGAAGRQGPWKTGVTIADVNGDKKLDIYVCYSGMVRDVNRVNQLFINEGNDENNIPEFTERAQEFGLASMAYSNQAYFFDYDRDGDLDLLLLNHNPNSLPVLNEVSSAAMMKQDDALKGIRLFKQTKGHFEDITKIAGINGSPLTYGLGAGVADLNSDGWPDVYISNDYAVPDFLYINNHNGTFSNKLQETVGHTSQFSMGNDIADVNNDGLPEIMTLDMLPEDNYRQKLLLAPDNYGKFDLNVRSGFYYQYMRNMLQLNNGNGTFSEIGQLAGISNTDWSWSALFADLDNNGWKDLLVTNGYYRDYTNLDFIKYMDDYVKTKGRLKREDVLDLIKAMPSSNVVNYVFANTNGIQFKNQTSTWGLNQPANSNGAAYADLDNDGDLDLVINNINQKAFVYQNESEKKADHHYLKIKLDGAAQNTQAIGAKVTLWCKGKKQHLEQMNARGYLSSVSPILHFGLGNESEVDSLVVRWLSGNQQIVRNVKADQMITLGESSSKKNANTFPSSSLNHRAVFSKVSPPFKQEAARMITNDFKRQSLLTTQLSYNGPHLAKGDVNNDGLEDVFVGGSAGQASALYIQTRDKKFIRKNIDAFEKDKSCEDVDAVFLDADKDGSLDLYVATGGYHSYNASDALLQDRLYLNDGKGNFTRNEKALPPMLVSKGCVAVQDVNADGYPDLFVGGRVIPGRYPEVPESFLLINDGKGNFENEIQTVAPALQKLGMITDAVWTDMNSDNIADLIVVGEWLPVSVFINEKGNLINQTSTYFKKEYKGWWNKIEASDFNKDGKVDFIVGNTGLNTQCKATETEPAELYYKDFDNNGSVDPFLCFYIQGKSYPYVTRDELLEQIGSFRSRFIDYKGYANVTISDLFKNDQLKDAGHLVANHLETSLFKSNTDGTYSYEQLPLQAQYAPVYSITILDYNKDGNDDALLCGNDNHAKLRMGKSDSNYGVLLQGDGAGGFKYIEQTESGFKLKGDVRSVLPINGLLLFGIGQQEIEAYKLL